MNQEGNEKPSGEGDHQERNAKCVTNTIGKARSGRPTEIVRALFNAALTVRPSAFGIRRCQLVLSARYGSFRNPFS
jgi:hypothetical protein